LIFFVDTNIALNPIDKVYQAAFAKIAQILIHYLCV